MLPNPGRMTANPYAERAASTSSSDVNQSSRPNSVYNTTPQDSSRHPATPNGDGQNSLAFEQDVRPRLVGLSQPFFATAPTVPNGAQSTASEQMAVLDRVTSASDGTKRIRVLVAEDNLVNQEVVLR